MASAYSTIMRHIDEWQWGPVILLAFEINPRSGPPDFSIDVTKEGHWSLIPCPCDDWQPSERDETEFALFLVTRRGTSCSVASTRGARRGFVRRWNVAGTSSRPWPAAISTPAHHRVARQGNVRAPALVSRGTGDA